MRTLKPQQTNSSTSPYGTLEQLQAIRSPVRQEILDHIYANGPATIADIAALLSVSPESLYSHIQALARVGSLHRCDTRATGKRPAAVYDVVPRLQRVQYDLTDAKKTAACLDITRAILRLTARDWEAALAGDDVTVDGPLRNLWAGRLTAWLDDDEVADLNTHFEAMVNLMRGSRPGPGKRLLAVTFASTPLQHREARRSSRT